MKLLRSVAKEFKQKEDMYGEELSQDVKEDNE